MERVQADSLIKKNERDCWADRDRQTTRQWQKHMEIYRQTDRHIVRQDREMQYITSVL